MIVVVALCLATFRLTHLVVDDDFPFGRAREWIVNQPGRFWSWFGELITCPWCSSMWLAAGLVAVTDRYADVPLPGLVWLAASGVAGYLSALEPE